MKFAYDYQNAGTRGWARGDFDSFGLSPETQAEAETALTAVSATWANGTDLRLVGIDVNGTETFPAITARGSRGLMPKDKNG